MAKPDHDPHRIGRPPLREGEQSTRVSIRVVDSDFDALCRLALRRRETIPEAIRRAVAIIIRGDS